MTAWMYQQYQWNQNFSAQSPIHLPFLWYKFCDVRTTLGAILSKWKVWSRRIARAVRIESCHCPRPAPAGALCVRHASNDVASSCAICKVVLYQYFGQWPTRCACASVCVCVCSDFLLLLFRPERLSQLSQSSLRGSYDWLRFVHTVTWKLVHEHSPRLDKNCLWADRWWRCGA